MRHQAANDQMTRLLIQKPVDYAELEETARIAVSVLQEDGWTIQRVGVEIRVEVVATPMIQENDPAAAALAEAQAKYVHLRRMVVDSNIDQWLAIMLGFILAAGMGYFGLGNWNILLAAVCFGIWAVVRKLSRTKGAA